MGYPPVTVHLKGVPEKCIIRAVEFLDGICFELAEHLDSAALASSFSAKALSKYAFAQGAFEVRHQYDCRLDD